MNENSSRPHRNDELAEVFHRAVRKVQEENRRIGVPNVYSFNGEIYYELPNGNLVRELPPEFALKTE